MPTEVDWLRLERLERLYWNHRKKRLHIGIHQKQKEAKTITWINNKINVAKRIAGSGLRPEHNALDGSENSPIYQPLEKATYRHPS